MRCKGAVGHGWGCGEAFPRSCEAPERLGVPHLLLVLHGLKFVGKAGVLRDHKWGLERGGLDRELAGVS